MGRDPHRLIKAIQKALTPDLLSPKWRQKVRPSDHPVTGHCYIAAETLWHLTGRKLRPKVCNLGRGETHWWLEDDQGVVYDPTAEQFDGPFPYERGRGCGFMTREPSKRCRKILSSLCGA